MEKLNEKGKVVEKGTSGIKEERLKMLRGNYQEPKFYNFNFTNRNINEDCSDMASCYPCWVAK